jgi:hypothetical protein
LTCFPPSLSPNTRFDVLSIVSRSPPRVSSYFDYFQPGSNNGMTLPSMVVVLAAVWSSSLVGNQPEDQYVFATIDPTLLQVDRGRRSESSKTPDTPPRQPPTRSQLRLSEDLYTYPSSCTYSLILGYFTWSYSFFLVTRTWQWSYSFLLLIYLSGPWCAYGKLSLYLIYLYFCMLF